jgi:hypothetical protein
MKKPNALEQLLEELQGEGIHSEVEVVKSSKAVIYPDDASAEAEDGIELTAKDCSLLFANLTTVERFLETLEDSQSASLALFDVNLPDSIVEELERNFVAVDEG